MADDQLSKLLGPLEAEVLRTVWAVGGPVTVRALERRLNAGADEPLAYTTVMTVMSRLVDKGALARRREGRAYVYEAAVRDAAELAVRTVVRDFGSSAVAHFVEQARADPELLRRLERIVEGRA